MMLYLLVLMSGFIHASEWQKMRMYTNALHDIVDSWPEIIPPQAITTDERLNNVINLIGQLPEEFRDHTGDHFILASWSDPAKYEYYRWVVLRLITVAQANINAKRPDKFYAHVLARNDIDLLLVLKDYTEVSHVDELWDQAPNATIAKLLANSVHIEDIKEDPKKVEVRLLEALKPTRSADYLAYLIGIFADQAHQQLQKSLDIIEYTEPDTDSVRKITCRATWPHQLLLFTDNQNPEQQWDKLQMLNQAGVNFTQPIKERSRLTPLPEWLANKTVGELITFKLKLSPKSAVLQKMQNLLEHR